MLFKCWVLLVALLSLPTSVSAGSPDYAGSDRCQKCHQTEYLLWQSSQHQQAMQPASEQTVLGDFSGVHLDHFGDDSVFFREDEQFRVTTANAVGNMQTFDIAYTFGVYPLQQYLVAFDDGRYQALSVAWDSRPASEGGQRWFHLYPDERIPAGDLLHWTGPYLNWNSRCADCHSTDLQRNYQVKNDSYTSQWSEVSVGCEACHGPRAQHAKTMQVSATMPAVDKAHSELRAEGQWLHGKDTATAQRYVGGKPAATINRSPQVAVCGSCHARRSLLVEPKQQPKTVDDFHNNHQLQLLDEGLYYADGQIQDEVFVLGSFMQSKMYHRGVTCANCHQPHSLQLKAEGNAVCTQCHLPAAFDVPAHHHHPAGAGSQCVNCHMPETTYMVVDPRRDHSLRIPRPDLSDELGSPNACVQCHSDKSNSWAATALEQWLKSSGKTLPQHYGEAIAAARAGQPQSDSQLLQLIANAETPGIVRATALSMLSSLPIDQRAIEQARKQLQATDPLVRGAAISVFSVLPIEQRLDDIFPLLADPLRSVRLAATAQLLGFSNPSSAAILTSAQSKQLHIAIKEYLASLAIVADTPNGQLNLALYHTAKGDFPVAEAAYRQALKLDRYYLGARLNLADLLRGLGRDAEGKQLLEKAIELAPQVAAAHHALGLLLIRQKQYPAAEQALKHAAELDPGNTRYGYIYAVALNSLGKPDQALTVLQQQLQRQPGSAELLTLAVELYLGQQRWQEALVHAQTLLSLNPLDSGLQNLVKQLRRHTGD